MSNHYHLVLKVDTPRTRAWSVGEVIEHWTILFAGPDLVRRFRSGQFLIPAECNKVTDIVEGWRDRLSNISWTMRVLNQHIARLANAEDNCTRRSWEGRFRSQALLHEQAVLTCMAYVDLNPIRAQMTSTPEQSDFTSIQQRISSIQQGASQSGHAPSAPPRYPLITASDATIDPAMCTADASPSFPSCPLLDFIGWKNASTGIAFDSTIIWNWSTGAAG